MLTLGSGTSGFSAGGAVSGARAPPRARTVVVAGRLVFGHGLEKHGLLRGPGGQRELVAGLRAPVSRAAPRRVAARTWLATTMHPEDSSADRGAPAMGGTV